MLEKEKRAAVDTPNMFCTFIIPATVLWIDWYGASRARYE